MGGLVEPSAEFGSQLVPERFDLTAPQGVQHPSREDDPAALTLGKALCDQMLGTALEGILDLAPKARPISLRDSSVYQSMAFASGGSAALYSSITPGFASSRF